MAVVSAALTTALGAYNTASAMVTHMKGELAKINVKDEKTLKTIFHDNLALQYKGCQGAIKDMDDFLKVRLLQFTHLNSE